MSSFFYEPPIAGTGSPYVGSALDNEEIKLADAAKEVDDFLQEFPPQGDYLDHLPEIPTPRCQYFREFENRLDITDGKSSNQANNLATISIEVPPPASDDVGEEFDIWYRSLNQIKIKLEYLSRHLSNLDVMANHGQAPYDQCISYYENLKSELKQLADDTQNIDWKGERNHQVILGNITLLQNETQRLVDRSTKFGVDKELQTAMVER